MVNLAQNAKGGFDIAELTHKSIGEALPAMLLPVSETAIKARLFLLSNLEGYTLKY